MTLAVSKTFKLFFHTLNIGAAKTAFGETEIINRIQQIGFAASIFPINANNIFVETELLKTVIAEMRECKLSACKHGGKIK
jgi:hypothetical protein